MAALINDNNMDNTDIIGNANDGVGCLVDDVIFSLFINPIFCLTIITA